MLEKLDQINWKSLAHPYGSAEDVPDLIRDLTSLDDKVRHGAWISLYSSIYYNLEVCEATALAVPFLLELIESEAVPERDKILNYLVDLANATWYFEQEWEESELEEEYYGTEIKLNKEKNWVEETRLAVKKGIPIYRKMLTHSNPKIRSAAAYVLGNIGTQTEEVLKQLRGLLHTEQEPLVKASIILSLSKLRDQNSQTLAFMNQFIQEGYSLIGIASAIAILRCDPNHQKAIRLLVFTLKNADEEMINLYKQLPPSIDVWLTREIFKSFYYLPKQQRLPYIPDLIAAFEKSEYGYLSLAWILLPIVFDKKEAKLSAQDLTNEQFSVLQSIANFDRLWKGGGDLMIDLEVYGLPNFRNQTEVKAYLNQI
ncbi:HEAT repeat domain-containing protein [Paenactinomyces guangxiensis]|uniref:HEAT repeat domain-containing protein n=1 Tax=Paenactinomyces guangxiensis TaxID=1490290 RepID=A0A7W2A774_9BACL|nr:HEAT repeat domain-containing protein [Paenactinomyces guangxiensis]MBA4492842.1 HEAT repeat domain-containing protein [Paenactinomyces guangxiensis]MBH8590309.1 HEAT repeat domain-containing protein [Paenactinomyces guangxiensis]